MAPLSSCGLPLGSRCSSHLESQTVFRNEQRGHPHPCPRPDLCLCCGRYGRRSHSSGCGRGLSQKTRQRGWSRRKRRRRWRGDLHGRCSDKSSYPGHLKNCCLLSSNLGARERERVKEEREKENTHNLNTRIYELQTQDFVQKTLSVGYSRAKSGAHVGGKHPKASLIFQ